LFTNKEVITIYFFGILNGLNFTELLKFLLNTDKFKNTFNAVENIAFIALLDPLPVNLSINR